jgi:hypothetical protein
MIAPSAARSILYGRLGLARERVGQHRPWARTDSRTLCRSARRRAAGAKSTFQAEGVDIGAMSPFRGTAPAAHVPWNRANIF